MSEREIRETLAAVCAELDEERSPPTRHRLRRVLLPTALGVTLVLGGGDAAGTDAGAGRPAPPPATDARAANAAPDAGMAVPMYGSSGCSLR